ncbi:hypothetical protein NL364_28580, partial [Klebsiella pneumoniae]|nr:hypothetical protein [Klebsiella pneumoniae]
PAGRVYGASSARLRLSTALSTTLCGLALIAVAPASMTPAAAQTIVNLSGPAGPNGAEVHNYVEAATGYNGGTGGSGGGYSGTFTGDGDTL